MLQLYGLEMWQEKKSLHMFSADSAINFQGDSQLVGFMDTWNPQIQGQVYICLVLPQVPGTETSKTLEFLSA